MGEAVAEHVRPSLRPGAAICFASGYAVAFGEVDLPDDTDLVMVAPRMIGVGVRETYEDGTGFIAFLGVERDATGNAWPLALGIARGVGATRRGCVEMTFAQEALIDLFVEQGIAPALQKVWRDAALVLLERGIPLEAVLAEFYLSGEIERTYRAMREIGPTKQWQFHSPTSQYGTMSRADRFDGLDTAERMRRAAEEIASGEFAKEWAAERERPGTRDSPSSSGRRPRFAHGSRGQHARGVRTSRRTEPGSGSPRIPLRPLSREARMSRRLLRSAIFLATVALVGSAFPASAASFPDSISLPKVSSPRA